MARKEKFSNLSRMASDCHLEVFSECRSVHADPKWTDYLLKEEKEEEPKLSLTERVNLMLEKEEKDRENAYINGVPLLNTPDDVEPVLTVKQPTKEEIKANCSYWKEKFDLAAKDCAIKWEVIRREMDLKKQMMEKKLIDSLPRDYYWKPNPLYSLHLKELGYSKIAIDRALFSVNNASAQAALEYLQENPNPKELTKEEVISVGKEALRKVKPGLPNTEYNADVEMEEISLITGNFNNHIPIDSDQRGLKRNYDGEVIYEQKTAYGIEIIAKEETISQENKISFSEENASNYALFLLRNLSLGMGKIPLALESSKVVVKIMNKLFHGNDEVRTMLKEWEENGSTMEMYCVRDSDILRAFQKEVETHGFINYMAETSQHVFEDAPSPTVLGFFGENKQMCILIENLSLS